MARAIACDPLLLVTTVRFRFRLLDYFSLSSSNK